MDKSEIKKEIKRTLKAIKKIQKCGKKRPLVGSEVCTLMSLTTNLGRLQGALK